MKDQKFTVQFVVVKEIQVETFDELQAERLAFEKLHAQDKDNAIAVCVLNEKDGGGALESEDSRDQWKFAREKFGSLDREWVQS